MFLGKRFVLMNQAPAEGSAGGTNGQTPPASGSTPPPAPPQAPGQSANALDFYGSQTPPPNPPAAPASQSQPPAPPAQPPANTPSVSGYGDPPPATPPAPPAPGQPPVTPPAAPPANPPANPPAGDPPAASAAEAYKTLNVEGVDATYVETFKNFAHSNKFTPEQAQALLDLKKSEMSAYNAETARIESENKAKLQSTRQAWATELRNDPVFGGEHFKNNIHLVDKYVAEFLPETNKHLTTNKTMLPPYVMRDLHRNALEAYKTDTFVNGAEGDTPNGNGDNYDPLAFYTQKQN